MVVLVVQTPGQKREKSRPPLRRRNRRRRRPPRPSPEQTQRHLVGKVVKRFSPFNKPVYQSTVKKLRKKCEKNAENFIPYF